MGSSLDICKCVSVSARKVDSPPVYSNHLHSPRMTMDLQKKTEKSVDDILNLTTIMLHPLFSTCITCEEGSQ